VRRLLHRFFHQFHQPDGWLGHVAGWMLAKKGDRALPLIEAAALQPTDQVLDIGCGPGVAVDRASYEVPRGHVTGIDPSKVMLSQARRRTRKAPNVTVASGSAEAVPLPDASIDVAWAINTFHHWADRGSGLAEVRRVLRPGGRFLVVEQNRQGRTGSALTDDAANAMAAFITAAGFVGSAVSDFEASGETHTLLQFTAPSAVSMPRP
jgi:ubiquinone/menaquinone biosynthesis C-methylase UbiE